MKFDVDDKNRCRLVCVKFHLNRCRFAAPVAKCLGGSLFWDTVYKCLCRSNVMHNHHKLNIDSNRNTDNIKIIKIAVESAKLCGKICSMRCTLVKYAKKCDIMRNNVAITYSRKNQGCSYTSRHEEAIMPPHYMTGEKWHTVRMN